MRRLTIRDGMVGAAASEVVRNLVLNNPKLTAVHVLRYHQPPLLQERAALDPGSSRLLQEALKLRRLSGIPFWDAVLLKCCERPEHARTFLEQAQLHQAQGRLRRLNRDDVEAGRVESILRERHVADVVALSSAVHVGGKGRAHIPLLDFHCASNSRNDVLVGHVCRRLLGAAVVLESGESYHAYGLCVVESQALRSILARAILFAPLIDRAYVAHQLLEGACALRLGTSVTKRQTPRVKFIAK